MALGLRRRFALALAIAIASNEGSNEGRSNESKQRKQATKASNEGKQRKQASKASEQRKRATKASKETRKETRVQGSKEIANLLLTHALLWHGWQIEDMMCAIHYVLICVKCSTLT